MLRVLLRFEVMALVERRSGCLVAGTSVPTSGVL